MLKYATDTKLQNVVAHLKKMRIFIIIIFIFSSNLNVIAQNKTCLCIDGIGSTRNDKPIKNFNFKNGQSLIICGFEENDLILEFNVIDCSSEKSISEYSAVQTCTYEFKNDTLKIFELKLLPSGKNWKWQFEKISVEIFTLKNNKIIKIPPKPIFYVDIQMSDFEQNEFINDIILNKDNRMQYDWEWEEIIGKLELLSLIKNEKALEILLNLEKITNYQLDGAFKEQYNDAVSNINWILNN